MGSVNDVQLRATLKEDSFLSVTRLLQERSWAGIAESSLAAGKIAHWKAGQDWPGILFWDTSGFGGNLISGRGLSSRFSVLHREQEILLTLAEWLNAVAVSWEMVITSDYLEDAFLVETSAGGGQQLVNIPLTDGRSPLSVYDLLPGARDWRPTTELGPVEYAMLPIKEIETVIGGKKYWMDLDLAQRTSLIAVGQKWSR